MAGFDPDAYLKQGAAPSFDPDAYLRGGQAAPSTSPVMDFIKSIPRGAMSNIASAASYAGESPVPPPDALLASTSDKMAALDKNFGLHQPQTAAGRFGQAVGATAGDPSSYIGPGSLALKAGGAILSGLGGQAGEEVGGGVGKVLGSLAGGVTAAKTLGPKAPTAAIPTPDELKGAAKSGYNTALASGLEVSPQSVSQFAAKAQQDLINRGFAPEIAGKTFGLLDTLQKAPANGTATAANLAALRQYVGRIAQETQPANGGMVKPTPDAAAASAVADAFKDYLENLSPRSVVAGDANAFTSATRQANANYAAAQRAGNFDARLTKAENTTDRQVAGSLDSQIKSKAGQMLDNPKNLRGLTQDEINQLQLINSGTLGSNVLRQLGRGGAGVIPLMTQAATAIPLAAATGGASIVPQLALAGGLYGARKASEAITKSRAQALADMLAMRSPLYQQRVNALPPADTISAPAQVARGLLGGF